jgi:glycosyltransferase involved in cell wall biosynthesis
MPSPKVTFIVPCFKLAHLLPECIESILSQTCTDFEVLIMDDCSPDDTATVARSFTDPRVRHVRNEPNLGHLRNYNKGIELAAGEYIWLISADDRLRKPYVLERYLAVMESNPRIGFAFCPGFGLLDGVETAVVASAALDQPDTVMDGRAFLRTLLRSNCILAPAALARKECYDRISVFPLDLPFAGDWFLWCAFALHRDVAYFAEPMVNYREHSGSMTSTLIADNIRRLSNDDFSVGWRMKRMIEAAGDAALAEFCAGTIVEGYIRALSAKNWRGAKFRMTLDEFEASLAIHAGDPDEQEAMRSQVLGGVGDHLYWDRDLPSDPKVYRLAIKYGRAGFRLRFKYGIVRMGTFGSVIMRTIMALREMVPWPQAPNART